MQQEASLKLSGQFETLFHAHADVIQVGVHIAGELKDLIWQSATVANITRSAKSVQYSGWLL